MATTQILPYATASGANVLTQAAYATQGTLATGMSSGIVPSNYFNKILRQASFMASAVANFEVNQGVSQPDDGDLPTAATNLASAIQALTRIKLTGATNYYVASTGSDSNAGTVGSPWLTIQHAVDYLYQNVDAGGQAVTINIADGSYTGNVSVIGPLLGGGTLQLTGNTTTPANCVISTTSNDCIDVSINGFLAIKGILLKTTTSGRGMTVYDGGILYINGNMAFGACANEHMRAVEGGLIKITSGYTISGSAAYHWNCENGGEVSAINLNPITLSGTPAFSQAFAATNVTGIIDARSVTFSGSATGTRFIASGNGVIYTAGASAGYLPGSIAGSAISGGIYM